MFIKKEEKELLALIGDPVARLLFFNAFFVIIGYGLAVATHLATVEIMKVFKTIFLFGSIVHLIITNRFKDPSRYFDSGGIPFLFCLLMFVFALASSDLLEALNRVQSFVIPFMYIQVSVTYLILKYGINTTLRGIHWGILLIYCIPALSYVLFGGDLSDTNIYGKEAATGGEVFVSNHYGWASTLYILSFIFVIRNISLTKLTKLFFWGLLIVEVILLFSSANRASWLSLSLAMIPLLLRYKGLRNWQKFAILTVLIALIIYFLSDASSGLNFQIERTLKQQKEGQARFEVTAVMFKYFNDNPINWITGAGLFNYDLLKSQEDLLSGYHNSYWEILFGAGIPLFLVFLSFMLIRPTYRFIKYYSRNTLLFFPLTIIPFFESDLTAGQFLFFPWFTFILLLNAKMQLWNMQGYYRTTHLRSPNVVLAR
jgi:hypothetical protein